ncbi:hypothetical protein MBLNU459_g6411t1 [Dothideomycetes sp. NU459]
MLPFLLSSLFTSAVVAQSSFSPARPPAIPLAVRSPYINTWQQAGSDGGNGGYLAGQWPTFWTGQITGWSGIVRVDGDAYTWLGAPVGPPVVTQSSFEYTSTKSIFSLSVNGTVGLNVTFLSPVTATDLKRQSIPASYMDVLVYSIDGQEHDVQLYTDVSAEWASGDRTNIASWNYGTTNGSIASKKRRDETKRRFHRPRQESSCHSTLSTVTTVALAQASANSTASTSSSVSQATGTTPAGGIAYHVFQRQTQQSFSQNDDQAEWGNWYYATESVAGLTYSNGAADVTARGAFIANGTLDNALNTDYRAINDAYPVFAFSIDYGSIGSTPQESTFTFTLAQEQAIQFESGTNTTTSVPSLWTSYFSNELDLVSFFYNDWTTALSTATALDAKVATDSIAVGGQDYLTITSLAVRQAFAATQLAGTTDTYYLFLKEISSDGDIQTVDVIFPSMPIFLYLNPDLVRLLLDPIFVYTEAGNFANQYALHDLGFYPNATQAGVEVQQVEESGNMVIMTLAMAQRTGNTAYLSTHYKTLAQWTQYLIDDSLIPENQISTDDFAGSLANQTNLALKGIIGIKAMSQIANLTNNTADAANYSSIAEDYITKWQSYAIAPAVNGTNGSLAHTTLNYGNDSSHGLLYNLWADALLNTNLVPKSVYQMQSDFYPTVNLKYGVPLDTRHSYTKADWETWCAAIAAPSTKQMFYSDIAEWINVTPTNRAFTDLYDAVTGDYPGINFVARPVVGGTFANIVAAGPLG